MSLIKSITERRYRQAVPPSLRRLAAIYNAPKPDQFLPSIESVRTAEDREWDGTLGRFDSPLVNPPSVSGPDDDLIPIETQLALAPGPR